MVLKEKIKNVYNRYISKLILEQLSKQKTIKVKGKGHQDKKISNMVKDKSRQQAEKKKKYTIKKSLNKKEKSKEETLIKGWDKNISL